MDPMGMYGYILDTCRVSGITSQSLDISIPHDSEAFLLEMSFFSAFLPQFPISQGFNVDVTILCQNTIILALVQANKAIWK